MRPSLGNLLIMICHRKRPVIAQIRYFKKDTDGKCVKNKKTGNIDPHYHFVVIGGYCANQ